MSSNCVYCDVNPGGGSEHVFPKSLGGQDVYMDCVCDDCNNAFSKFERELFQKSIIGLMRSYEGIEGYSKNKLRPAPLKFPEIFQHDKKNGVVYEVGLHQGFKPYLRPQFIKIQGSIYCEASSKEEIEQLVKVFNKWRQENLTMITAFPEKKGDKYEAVQFELNDDVYAARPISVDKVKRELIHYTLMKDNDQFKDHLTPRLFIDDGNNLTVRSRTVEEGVDFMAEFLNYCNRDKAPFNSYSQNSPNEPIRVSMKFNIDQMQQALVKIGLNALMHYYPETKRNLLLKPAKDYALKGGDIKRAIVDKIDLLDTNPNIHSVLIYQLKEGLQIRTSLFGGQFGFAFLIEDLALFPRPGHLSGVEVDFKGAKQQHYPMDMFMLNRAKDLGLLNQSDLEL